MDGTSIGNGTLVVRSSMAPASDPLAIAAQCMLVCPYVVRGSVEIKLTAWFGRIVGNVCGVEMWEESNECVVNGT